MQALPILLASWAVILGAIFVLRLDGFPALTGAANVVSCLAPGDGALEIARVAERSPERRRASGLPDEPGATLQRHRGRGREAGRRLDVIDSHRSQQGLRTAHCGTDQEIVPRDGHPAEPPALPRWLDRSGT